MAKILASKYADMHGLSKQRILKLIGEGRIKSAEKVDGRWLIDEDDDIIYINDTKKAGKKPGSRTFAPDDPNRPDGLVSLKEYANLHNTTVPSIRWRLRLGWFKSSQKINNVWFLDPNEPIPEALDDQKDFKAKRDLSFDNYVTVREYAQNHGVSSDSVKIKIAAKKMKTAISTPRGHLLDPDEPWIDHRVKSGKYVTHPKKMKDHIGDFALEKYGLNDLSGAISLLLSDETFLKTKKAKDEDYYINTWHMTKDEVGKMQNSLYDALHPDH